MRVVASLPARPTAEEEPRWTVVLEPSAAIADLAEKDDAAQFLSQVSGSPEMPRSLRAHARRLSEALAMGVFR